MTFTPALTATEYELLRGDGTITPSHAVAQYLSLVPNTNVVTSTVASITNQAELILAGSAAAALAGQTVLISKTNDRRAAFFRGRVRKAPSGTTLYINQTAADIEVGDYVWVLDDFDIHPKAARDTGTDYTKDYDAAYHKPAPVIYDLQSAYAAFVDPTSEVLELTFSPNVLITNPDAGAGTWAWDEGDGTITVGTSASREITVEFPAGFRWVHITYTDSTGVAQTFHIQVHAHHPDDYPPALGFSGAEITGDVDGGFSATVSAFDGVDAVLDRTGVVIWSEEWYNLAFDNLYGVPGAVEFVGRLRRETQHGRSDPDYSFLVNADFALEGPVGALQWQFGQTIAIRDTVTQDEWDELETLTVWRAICHYLDTHTTFLTVCALTFDDTGDAFQSSGLGTIQGAPLEIINNLAETIDARIEFGYDGRAQVVRNTEFLTDAQRASVDTLADFEAQDLIDLDLDHDHVDTIGQVDAYGGSFGAVSGYTLAVRSLAPGIVRNEGGGEVQRTRELLARNQTQLEAQAELNFRSGQALVAFNQQDELTITFPPGYHPFVPSRAALYTWTLNGSDPALRNLLRGIDLDTSTLWMLKAISHGTDNATGVREVQATYRHLRPVQPSGETATIPASTDVSPALNSVLPWTPYLSFPELPGLYMPEDPAAGDLPPGLEPNGFVPRAPTDGSVGLQWDAGDVNGTSALYYVTRALTNAPRHRDITPTSGEVKHAVFDIDGAGAYCLMYFSGPDVSRIYHTDNVHAAAPAWSQGGALEGEYFILRRSGTLGRIYAARVNEVSGATGTTYTYDFESSAQTWEADVAGTTRISGDSYNYGTYCWRGTGTVDSNRVCEIYKDFAPEDAVELTGYQFSEKPYNGFAHTTRARFIVTHDGGITTYQHDVFSGSGQKWEVFTRTGIHLTGVTHIEIQGYESSFFNNWIELDHVILTGVNVGIIESGDVFVGYSDDAGETIEAETNVGNAGVGNTVTGFDSILFGEPLLVGIANAVQTSDDAETWGAESNGGVAGTLPVALLIPPVQFDGSTPNFDIAVPVYYLGANSGVYGPDQSLWRVTGAGKVDISPFSGLTLAIPFHPDGIAFMWKHPEKIVLLASVAGDIYLFASEDMGDSWIGLGGFGDGTRRIGTNPSDSAGVQLFIADGENGPIYSPDFAGTFIQKPYPTPNHCRGWIPYG